MKRTLYSTKTNSCSCSATMSLQVRSKKDAIGYWKLRLLSDALEKISLTDEPKPGINISTKKALKQVLAESTIQPLSPTGVGFECPSPEVNQELGDTKNLVFIHKWIKIELNDVATTVVDAYKSKLIESNDEKDKELLKKLISHSNPLDLISHNIAHDLEEEASLDSEIEKWTRIRDSELEACHVDAKETNYLLSAYAKELNSGRYGDTMKRYTEYLKLQSEFLTTKQMLTDMRQKIDENPPEVMNELEGSYQRLLDTQDHIETRIYDLSNKKAKYDLLGPEFVTLLADWNEYGRLIQQKEFVLNGMDAVASNEQSFDVSLNSSLVFESP